MRRVVGVGTVRIAGHGPCSNVIPRFLVKLEEPCTSPRPCHRGPGRRLAAEQSGVSARPRRHEATWWLSPMKTPRRGHRGSADRARTPWTDGRLYATARGCAPLQRPHWQCILSPTTRPGRSMGQGRAATGPFAAFRPDGEIAAVSAAREDVTVPRPTVMHARRQIADTGPPRTTSAWAKLAGTHQHRCTWHGCASQSLAPVAVDNPVSDWNPSHLARITDVRCSRADPVTWWSVPRTGTERARPRPGSRHPACRPLP